jgi:hypothetical protein
LKKETIGKWMFALGFGLLIFLGTPLNIDLVNMRYSVTRTREFTVLENCHGTPCYVADTDSRLQRLNAVITPLGVVLAVAGGLMFGWFDKDRSDAE